VIKIHERAGPYFTFVVVFESHVVAVVRRLVPFTSTATYLPCWADVSLNVLRVAPVIFLQIDGTVMRADDEVVPRNPPPSAENGVDGETEPNLGKVAFRAGRTGGERGIRTLDGITPKPHFKFAPEEGSEGLSAPPEVRCRCLEDS